MPVLAQSPKPTKCFNGSIGVSGSLMGGLVGGPTGVGVGGSGGQSVGFSYGGSFLDSNVFWSSTAAGMGAGGVFGGGGVLGQRGFGGFWSGVTSTTGVYTGGHVGAWAGGGLDVEVCSV